MRSLIAASLAALVALGCGRDRRDEVVAEPREADVVPVADCKAYFTEAQEPSELAAAAYAELERRSRIEPSAEGSAEAMRDFAAVLEQAREKLARIAVRPPIAPEHQALLASLERTIDSTRKWAAEVAASSHGAGARWARELEPLVAEQTRIVRVIASLCGR